MSAGADDRYGVSAGELDLLSFFACAPESLDKDVPWASNDHGYRIERGDAGLHFAIAPSCRDVRIRWSVGASLVYELNALAVEDVRYHRDSERETLEIAIDDRQSIFLSIDPAIVVRHEVRERR